MRVYSYKTPKPNTNGKGHKSKPKRKFSFSLGKFWKNLDKKKTFTWIFRLFALGVLCTAVLFLYYAKDLPDPDKLLDRKVPESTKILARDGSLLYEIHGEYRRTLIGLDQIPEYAKQATIALEDKDFYKHHGLYFKGIARSVFRYVINFGPEGGGGSTLTQQFVKNAILTGKKSIFGRKIPEAILSLSIEAKFSKEDILKLYLNEIPYGRNAYGIEAAALSYFNKSAKDLTLAESAYLAALPQAPTFYNPLGPNRQSLDNRKNTALALMQQQGYINEEQKLQAQNEKVEFSPITYGLKAPHFSLWVQNYLAGKYGEKTLEEGGLKVYTTLDPKLQEIAEAVVKENLEKYGKRYEVNNAALVAIDPKTGQILAMVGGKDYFGKSEPEGCSPGKNCMFEPNVNVAIAQRQPGSSFKPYVYVTAFKKDFGYSPASMLMDVVTNFGTYAGKEYVPNNYNGQNYGPLPMRKTLAGSLNIPAVKTLSLVGVENATQTAHDLGITSPLVDCGLSLVLGGCEVRLLDHVAAYSVIANRGIKNEKTAILKIEDSQGRVIEEFKENPQTVLDEEAIYQLTSIMTDNDARSFVFGANSPLTLSGRPVAAKTGTTNDWGDGWTMGFTPSLAAGVWTGNNCGGSKCPMKRGADGVLTAAPIWHDFMQKALAETPAEEFKVPSGIQKVVVDDVSGKLPTDATPSLKQEIFASYSVPTQYDDVHVKVPIDTLTGLPADNQTPPDRISYRLYTALHSERRDNPDWENPVVEWALAHGYTYPPTEDVNTPPGQSTGQKPNVDIEEPLDGSTVMTLPVTVKVSASGQNVISRVDISVDGDFVQSITQGPFVFSLNKNYGKGEHTIAVKAVDIFGNTNDTSVRVKFDIGGGLQFPQD